ncbi:MAG: hypothetical protein D6754_12535 [Alphaproteobacteria bacterium]|nr:MAG: hypothetical protein D6754_12535 [Alphaproteobacteria bacterium]
MPCRRPRGRIRAAILTAGLALFPAGPGAAEPVNPEAAWGALRAICVEFMDRPGVDTVKPHLTEPEAVMGRTTDGFGLFAVIPRPDLVAGSVRYAAAFLNAQYYPDGTAAQCMLQLAGTSDLDTGTLMALADVQADEILGKGWQRFGGPVLQGLKLAGAFRLYRLPGFPPPRTLRIENHGKIVVLGLTRHFAEATQ